MRVAYGVANCEHSYNIGAFIVRMGCRDQYTIVILRNSQKGIANDLPTLGLYVSQELVAYFRLHMKAQRSKTVSADLYTPNA